ncbi:MAG: hypothetical protein ACC661_09090 [Verrucomicrobiales bacterium]
MAAAFAPGFVLVAGFAATPFFFAPEVLEAEAFEAEVFFAAFARDFAAGFLAFGEGDFWTMSVCGQPVEV